VLISEATPTPGSPESPTSEANRVPTEANP
jgi:hypothetical protein